MILGCEAMFQFKIWESGRLEDEVMEKSIKQSIEHSLWDLNMERRFLVTPLLANFALSPPISQPTSPIKSEDFFFMKRSEFYFSLIIVTAIRQFGSPKGTTLTQPQLSTDKSSSPLSYNQVNIIDFRMSDFSLAQPDRIKLLPSSFSFLPVGGISPI